MNEMTMKLVPGCARVLCIACLSLAVTACATFRSYDGELSQTLDLVASGEIERAVDTHERHNRFGKDLLYYLEKGELLRLAGRYEESQSTWLEADKLVGKWEETARLNPDLLLRDVASLLVNDSARAYQGQDFEKVMLTTRMALNHISLGQWDLARVAIKRTHEREALVSELRAEQVRRLEDTSEADGKRRDVRELNGYPVQTIDIPEVNALRNSYQSAFSHYLAGFVYEALGESGLAAAGYRQAIELRPGVVLLEQGLSDLDTRVSQSRTSRPDEGNADLLVVIETGSAPARRSVSFSIPVFSDKGILVVPVSFPVIDSKNDAEGVAIAALDEEQIGVNRVTSVDAMSRRALRDEMPWIMLRAVARATTKATLQSAARNSDESGLAGAVAIIGSIITERADERSWRSLPAMIGIARYSVDRGVHNLTVDAGNRRHQFEVDIEGDFALVSVRLFGGEAYISVSQSRIGPG